jgi:hypothetical protein
MRRRLSTIASVVSLLLCVATAGVLIYSIGSEITWGFVMGGVRWEIACQAGKVGIDNDPEIWEAGRPQREEAAIREAFNKEPWGSAGYYKALEQLKASHNAREGKSVLPTAVIPRIEYAIRLELLIALEMALPALWFWRLRSRRGRRPAGRIGSGVYTVAAALSLLLCAVAVVFWVRSYSRSEDINRNSITRDGVHRLVTVRSWHGSIYVWHNHGTQSPALSPVVTTWFVHSVRTQRATFTTTLGVSANVVLADPSVTYSAEWKYALGGVNLEGHRYRRVTASNTGRTTAAYRFSGAIVPYWLLVVLLLSCPALWAVARVRRAFRHIAGHCRKCRYNLTGNTSGVCPECGTAIKPA